MTRKQQKTIRLLAILAVVITLSAVDYCRSQQPTSQPTYSPADSVVQALLYVDTPDNLPNTLLHYTGMNIGFNPDLHIPNWVAWQLTEDETQGAEPRTNKFLPDENVEASAMPYDYSYSGYDRGHMAPAGDMKWSRQAIEESFLMTNITPQTKALNTGTWKKLEEKCRLWARALGDIYIVCGPVNTDTPLEYIGDSHVAVPRRFFKAIISLNPENPRGIGFLMPNGNVPGGLQKAAVTIDEIERVTGLDLFPALDDNVETDVESQCDFHYWSTLIKRQ